MVKVEIIVHLLRYKREFGQRRKYNSVTMEDFIEQSMT